MARWISLPLVVLLLSGCGDAISKGDALTIIQHDVKEDAHCTLPINILSSLKTQFVTKAMCVPKGQEQVGKCVDAMALAGLMKPMPSSYMLEWPDELSKTGLDEVAAYDRKSRDQIYRSCVEMTEELRRGGFKCGDAKAEKVVRVTKLETPKEVKRVTVRYSRAITPDPRLDEIDAPCGGVTRPAPEGNVTMEKIESRWVVVPSDSPVTPTSSSSAH